MAKIREVHPKVLRRKVEIPHYDLGGTVLGGGGLFGGIGSGLNSLAGDLTAQNQYQAQQAPINTVGYAPTIGSAATNAGAGFGNFNNNQAQQQGVVNTLGQVASGQGPNPAQNMLNQATGANVANQAALMASNRGAGANAGLIARQAAMAGSNAQQQAAGQAATLQSQQQLGALGQQGQVLGQMGQQNIGEQNANTSLFGTAGQLNNAQNNSMIQNYGMAQGLNQNTAQNNANNTNKTEGGLLNGLGGVAAGLFGLAKGGMVPDHFMRVAEIYHGNPKLAQVPEKDRFCSGGMYADGGAVPTSTSTSTSTATATAAPIPDTPVQTRIKKAMQRDYGEYATESYADGGAVAPDFKGVQYKIGNWATDGMSANQIAAERVNADPRTSAPEADLPQDIKQPAVAAQDYRSGGRVPGQAMVAGDSLKNDVQPAMLSPKEIVLPRHITMAPDAPEKAKQFVAAILKKQGHGNSKQHKEFHMALKKAILSRKS